MTELIKQIRMGDELTTYWVEVSSQSIEAKGETGWNRLHSDSTHKVLAWRRKKQYQRKYSQHEAQPAPRPLPQSWSSPSSSTIYLCFASTKTKGPTQGTMKSDILLLQAARSKGATWTQAHHTIWAWDDSWNPCVKKMAKDLEQEKK